MGVVLRVCNEDGGPRVSTDRFMLEDAFGTRLQPVELAADNALAYQPQQLAKGEYLLADGSPAEATLGGGALVFRVSLDVRRNAPLGLEIITASGECATIEISL